MTTTTPGALWLLVLVAAAAGCYVVLQRQRRHHAVRFTNLRLLDAVAVSRPGWRRHVTAGVMLLAMTVLAVAASQPVVERDVDRDQAIVVVAIDVSRSMEATDVPPSRLAAAKRAAGEFVAGLPDTFQVGVVAYGGTVQVVATPTTDHEAAAAAITRLRTIEGTATGEALAASLDAIVQTLQDAGLSVAPAGQDGVDPLLAPAVVGDADADAGTVGQRLPATVVLLSDGASADGRPVPAVADRAVALGVPVSTITYGTADGTVLLGGEVVAVPPDARTMESLARTTGGLSFTATSGDELTAVYDDIAAEVGTVTVDQDVTIVAVLVGLVLLLAGFALGMVWSGRVL